MTFDHTAAAFLRLVAAVEKAKNFSHGSCGSALNCPLCAAWQKLLDALQVTFGDCPATSGDAVSPLKPLPHEYRCEYCRCQLFEPENVRAGGVPDSKKEQQ